MSIRVVFRNPEGTPEDITSRFFLNTLDVKSNAEECTTALSEWLVDDEDAAFDIRGHRVFGVRETRVNDSLDQYLYVGYTGERIIDRGPVPIDNIDYGTEDGRVWRMQLVDINTVVERRVMLGSDSNRPAETDVARMQWAVGTNEASLIDDTRYLSTANGVAMDAVDYRGQRLKDVFDDCAQQSGKNYFLWWAGDAATATDPWGHYSLFYDFASSPVYDSTIRLSNVESDIDGTTTLSYESAVLTRSPERVYSGVYLPYDGGNVFEQNMTTRTNFALGGRDMVAPSLNVKSQAKAVARAQRYLADLSTEEDVIKVSFICTPEQVNALRQGHRVLLRASHLPGYEQFTYLRALNRQVQQVSNDAYRITAELSYSDPSSATTPNVCPSPTATGNYPPNLAAISAGTGNVFYTKPGLEGPEVPTPGFVGAWNFAEFNSGGVDYAGDCSINYVRCLVVGDGTITIDTRQYGGASRTLTWALFHREGPGADEVITDQSGSVASGSDITVNVTSHGGAWCTHWVDVTDNGAVCGSKWGFAGFDWAAT